MFHLIRVAKARNSSISPKGHVKTTNPQKTIISFTAYIFVVYILYTHYAHKLASHEA